MTKFTQNDKLWAHTPPPGNDNAHLLEQHLISVAVIAEEFGKKFGAGTYAKALGLSHDLAKADPRFQKYLRYCLEGNKPGRCPHSAPSASATANLLGPFALAVLGHHAGMPDASDAKHWLSNADPKSVEAAKEMLKTLPELPTIEEINFDKLTGEMLIRMVFSCLVDADFLDTERHFKPDLSSTRAQYPSLSEYLKKLNIYLEGFKFGYGKVNQVRSKVLEACKNCAENPRGFFRLTVPTGGGKTLSGLAFALNHAVKNKMDRVIVAIPYTSIIDQTTYVYASALGQENVLPHHSAIESEFDEDSQSESQLRRKLNTENWDCPLIVTTTVQLFESLFHNRPAKCRKLHNIANSVIVLDEVQALPTSVIKPILDVLCDLVENYNCTVVFCTATQLDYSVINEDIIKNAVEIVENNSELFTTLKRVEFQVEDESWSLSKLVESIHENNQALAVFNTRKDALNVGEEFKKVFGEKELFYLSSLMCPHHRRNTIKEIRSRLDTNQPVTLISTQVVEAGVDLDFPIVFRDTGPLDRIIQVAGRCNREGKLDGLGKCIIFSLEEASTPAGAYRTGTEITKALIREYGSELDSKNALSKFSNQLFNLSGTDSKGIQSLRQDLNYASVATNFKLIGDDTSPVIIGNYPCEDVSVIIEEWHENTSGWFKRIMPFAVNLFKNDINKLEHNGEIRIHESGAFIYSGVYDRKFGLQFEINDPSDLIV